MKTKKNHCLTVVTSDPFESRSERHKRISATSFENVAMDGEVSRERKAAIIDRLSHRVHEKEKKLFLGRGKAKTLLIEFIDTLQEAVGWNATAIHMVRLLLRALANKIAAEYNNFKNDIRHIVWTSWLELLEVSELFIFYTADTTQKREFSIHIDEDGRLPDVTLTSVIVKVFGKMRLDQDTDLTLEPNEKKLAAEFRKTLSIEKEFWTQTNTFFEIMNEADKKNPKTDSRLTEFFQSYSTLLYQRHYENQKSWLDALSPTKEEKIKTTVTSLNLKLLSMLGKVQLQILLGMEKQKVVHKGLSKMRGLGRFKRMIQHKKKTKHECYYTSQSTKFGF